MVGRVATILLAVASLLQLACGPKPALKRPETYSQVRRLFQDPPARYRTAPFWVWNDRVTRSMIDEQLAALKKQGIGGVFIHPRYGLLTEYLSPEWFELIAYATKRARELGMDVWLYDENSYPSGFAGGHVPAQMPESYRLGQGLVPERRDSLPTPPGPEYVVILEQRGDHYEVIETPEDAIGRPGPFVLFRKVSYPMNKWYGGFAYVDLLLPGVTEKFIQVTMTGYERAVGKEFGRTVLGVFTDEPHIRPPQRDAVRWTPDLFERFRERFGYDLRPLLPSLFEETGEWRKVRHDYRRLLLELFESRWAEPWERYCRRAGLLWTGHYWEHTWPDPSECPDGMVMYVHHHVPGIDLLFNQFSEAVNAQFGNVRSVREVASIANQFDRPRVLSETYGGAGWELTFADMKRLGDWEYVLGVNLMNQHLTLQSLKGDRKMDYPQSFGPHAPWWPLYRYLADYFARLSVALSSGREVNRILVLEPSSSAWMYAKPGSDRTELLNRVGEPFQRFVTRLSHEQVEYDLGSEVVLEKYGKTEGGKLMIGAGQYEAVLLPPGFESAERATVELLRRFLRAGGKVYAFSSPAFLEGRPSDWWGSLRADFPQRWVSFDSLTVQALEALRSHQSVQFVGVEGSWLFHQQRVLKDGRLLFLVNSSLEEPVRGSAIVSGASAFCLDPVDGDATLFPAETLPGGRLRITFHLPPAGSLLLFVGSKGKEKRSPLAEEVEFSGAETSPLQIRRDSLNVLVLDYCDVRVDTVEKAGLFFAVAQDLIWQHHGFPENPWFRGIQFRRQLVEADTFGAETGFEATFPFHVLELPRSDKLYLVVEQPAIWKVFLNGAPLEPLPGRTWLDPDFAVYPVAGLLREGRNEVRIVCRPMSIYAELEPVYLLGEFSLVPLDRGWGMVAERPLDLGPWRDQGCPFYGHSVTYQKQLKVASPARIRVRLGSWAGTVAEVRVNGRSAGILAWPPYQVEVSGEISPGSHTIEVVVYGSLRNVLGPYHAEPAGQVRPWLFRQAPAEQPRGDQYRLLPYGLMEDFAVEVAPALARSQR
ncbi:MAG: glycosyl hydrolase [candidate division KSB1 bacterium]|nr:glycosyl hydrolase [candidate division KSB1 bacterium]